VRPKIVSRYKFIYFFGAHGINHKHYLPTLVALIGPYKDYGVRQMLVRVAINTFTKDIVIEPIENASVLIKKRCFERHEMNLSIRDVIDIARRIWYRSNSKTLRESVLEIVGTCVSIPGCMIENKHPHEITSLIKSGEIQVPYDV